MPRQTALITDFQTVSTNHHCISWPVPAPMVTYGSSENATADYPIKHTLAQLTAFATPQNTLIPPS